MRNRWLILTLTAAILPSGCGAGDKPSQVEPSSRDLKIEKVLPEMLLPGSRIAIIGGRFLPNEVADTSVRVSGLFEGHPVDTTLVASYVSPTELELYWPGGKSAGLGIDKGTFMGQIEVNILEDTGRLHLSNEHQTTLHIQSSVVPRVDRMVDGGILHINDPIAVDGDDFLLGGEEGTTTAVFDGCFYPDGEPTCVPIQSVAVAAKPLSSHDRAHLGVEYAPSISGIHPGTFEGSIRLRNEFGKWAQESPQETIPVKVKYQIDPPTVYAMGEEAASLGQFVDIVGGGFVGGSDDEVTIFQAFGAFYPDGFDSIPDVDIALIGRYESGQMVHYVLSEDDSLGLRIQKVQKGGLRSVTGRFEGKIRPIAMVAGDSVEGAFTDIHFSVAPVKQVVVVNFEPSYVRSLRHFGLRAVDDMIRNRVFQVGMRDYRGVNLEFRAAPPKDFALYSQVDITGADPNGYGFLGYDNSPGKDVDNLRLFDHVGGESALSQQDGAPGYGGVFVEQLFGFSAHPGEFAKSLDISAKEFDMLFDPFRPDVGGVEVNVEDFAAGPIPVLTSGDGCPAPASDRRMQIACAVHVLGSMVGSTMTHEVGHSLGLSDPYGRDFHNAGDAPNRLMDGGSYRPFLERAEILGQGPAVFCDEDYAYLRQILPTQQPDPVPSRPRCR